MSAPDPSTIARLRQELLDERERHEASLAQLEILGEELITAGEQLTAVSDALAIAREETETLRWQLHALALERHELEARFTGVLHGSPTMVFEQNLQLRYVWACATPFGRHLDEILGLHDDDLFSGAQAEALSAMKREVLRALQPSRTTVHLTIGGSLRQVDVYLKPLEDGVGTVTGICGIATDLAPFP